MCFSQLELGANLGWITSQHPALKIDTRHGNPMTHHLNDINNAVSTYFVWLVWTASSWWWWPGAPCPCKYSCHSSDVSQCPGQWEAAVLTIDQSEALTWCPPASWSRTRPWWGTEWPGGPPASDWWDWSPGHLITSGSRGAHCWMWVAKILRHVQLFKTVLTHTDSHNQIEYLEK